MCRAVPKSPPAAQAHARGLEHLHLVLHVGGKSQSVEGGQRLGSFGRRPGQCQGVGGQRFAPAGTHGQREVEEDRSGAGRLQECCLHPALFQAERRERRRDDRALLRAPVRRQLLLRLGQESFGLAEPAESDQGEDMVPERAPRFGQDGRALADGCAGGRDEEGQSLMHAAGASEAPAEEGVHAGERSTVRLRNRLHRLDHGPRASSGGVEAQASGKEFVAPGGMEIGREQRVNGCHVGGAVQEEFVIELEEGDLDALARLGGHARQAVDLPTRPARVDRSYGSLRPPGVAPRSPVPRRWPPWPCARRARTRGVPGPPWLLRRGDPSSRRRRRGGVTRGSRVSSWRLPADTSASSWPRRRWRRGLMPERTTSP